MGKRGFITKTSIGASALGIPGWVGAYSITCPADEGRKFIRDGADAVKTLLATI